MQLLSELPTTTTGAPAAADAAPETAARNSLRVWLEEADEDALGDWVVVEHHEGVRLVLEDPPPELTLAQLEAGLRGLLDARRPAWWPPGRRLELRWRGSAVREAGPPLEGTAGGPDGAGLVVTCGGARVEEVPEDADWVAQVTAAVV